MRSEERSCYRCSFPATPPTEPSRLLDYCGSTATYLNPRLCFGLSYDMCECNFRSERTMKGLRMCRPVRLSSRVLMRIGTSSLSPPHSVGTVEANSSFLTLAPARPTVPAEGLNASIDFPPQCSESFWARRTRTPPLVLPRTCDAVSVATRQLRKSARPTGAFGLHSTGRGDRSPTLTCLSLGPPRGRG
ncbi:hypothetical protein L227DRAFT_396199 [Lentinus tigrinus ALCF2SS1-6]|uniref:Uncharacterized protein n=1 Tax=Lentinus tigrinus ALCF2SS1-6 TaxID=1328759 RepID=A0A5C2RPW2_9APHY|nr:hypothetical protein L227DRAFT_396199 [Lentinus tigrinus ALCF2SS1-6]